MVLLAAAVCNKAGKAIISRQFVEMNRSRIEGLLAAFPKLMNTGKQHTFVETESVRYVYQPLEKLYMLLITTKASNILEDLETLRLFARVIPEYCRNLEESDIVDQSFPLIFAFDEIIALGYRENVNLAQIRTLTEMDSLEEKIYIEKKQTQEKEARDKMREKAKELQKLRRDAAKGGRMPGYGGSGGGFGNNTYSRNENVIIDTTSTEPVKSSYVPPSKTTGKALKLGSKKKDVDIFVGQLESEGEKVTKSGSQPTSVLSKISVPTSDQESVHVVVEEKITMVAGRDGGLQNLEVHGILKLKINDDKNAKVKLVVANNDTKGVQIQTHPNIDKKVFAATGHVGLKTPDKPFPLNTEIGVLKWRFQSNDESLIPLYVNPWPNESGTGCDVNIEYELRQPELELNDVLITIPLPSGVGAPVVGDYDGEYHYDNRKNFLQWTLPVIDQTNPSGSMEFSIAGQAEDFYPVTVSFLSRKSYCDIEVTEVLDVDSEHPVKYSSDVIFFPEKYEIV
ncbi:hypothetical protein ScPMuIL_003452 [Solemya velum]